MLDSYLFILKYLSDLKAQIPLIFKALSDHENFKFLMKSMEQKVRKGGKNTWNYVCKLLTVRKPTKKPTKSKTSFELNPVKST